jgi:D-galactarolactone cycloisomerase
MSVEIVDLSASVHTYEFVEPPRPLALGSALRRDFVLVRVECADGTVGYGEAFHGHAGTAVAEIVNTTMREVVIGRRVDDMLAVREETRNRFLVGAGMGGFQLALSGIDLAMWDAYGKYAGQPVYRLLGGVEKAFKAYAGGFTLGFSSPDVLVNDMDRLVESGYQGAKVRVGDSYERDVARVRAVREAFGIDFHIMTDANLGLNYDATRLTGVLGDLGIEWLEEPYTPQRMEDYIAITAQRRVPIAAGENMSGPDRFSAWMGRRAFDIAQPDVSRCGGITEAVRISAVASSMGIRVVPHISHTGLNQAATLHVMSGTGSHDFFEADATDVNPFRDGVISGGFTLEGGFARLTDAPGLGVSVDEEELKTSYAGRSGSPWPRPATANSR